MKTKLPCGCTHDVVRWLECCPVHELEWRERHAAALREHAAGGAVKDWSITRFNDSGGYPNEHADA